MFGSSLQNSADKMIAAITLFILFPVSDETPLYPLYAIESYTHGYSLSDSDCQVMATNFSYMQAKYITEELQLLKKVNPDFQVVSYINSGIATSDLMEKAGRLNSSYYLCGELTSDVGLTDYKIVMAPSPHVSPLKASTTNGNFSSLHGYVTFLRIGDELMKILRVETSSTNETTVTITRSFANTSAQHYSNKSLVFCPVYHSTNYPDGNSNSSIIYTLDPGQQLAVDVLVNHTLTSVDQGYRGSWFDLFSAGQFNAVDMGGKHVKASWDFKTNQPYTRQRLLQAQKNRLSTIYRQCYEVMDHYPTLLANNVAGSYWADDGDGKQLVEKTSSFRPLDGYSLEAFCGYEDADNHSSSSCGPSGLILSWQPFDKWLQNVQIVMDAAQSDVAIFPMIASAGCQSIALELVNTTLRNKFENFAYASYLLAVEKPSGATHLGLPAFYQSKGSRYAFVHPRYLWPIGAPTKTVNPEHITDYQPNNHISFVRPFSNGIVVVNPHNQTDNNLSLNGTYHDPTTGQIVTSLTADSQSGYIFLLNK